MLAGGPGVGKTELWHAGVGIATDLGWRLLSARPTESEARLSLAAVSDLLDGIETDVLAAVPAPARRALEVALLRTDPKGPPPELRAIGTGLLHVLRELADRGPVIVAIDDVQWLDPSSAEALAYAGRRLRSPGAVVLLTERTGQAHPLARTLEATGAKRIDVSGLTITATRVMLQERLGLTLPGRMLRRVFDASDGNPLFSLELARALAEGDWPGPGEPLPVPSQLGQLLSERMAKLPAPTREALLAIALLADPTAAAVDGTLGRRATDALEQAQRADLIEVRGSGSGFAIRCTAQQWCPMSCRSGGGRCTAGWPTWPTTQPFGPATSRLGVPRPMPRSHRRSSTRPGTPARVAPGTPPPSSSNGRSS